jgi:hypothetical protein
MDHISVFSAETGINPLMLNYHSNQALFADIETTAIFEHWLSNYAAKFPAACLDGLTFPPPGDRPYPYVVCSPQDMFETWAWCSENCEGEVRISLNYFFFENDGDATIFKLKFG